MRSRFILPAALAAALAAAPTLPAAAACDAGHRTAAHRAQPRPCREHGSGGDGWDSSASASPTTSRSPVASPAATPPATSGDPVMAPASGGRAAPGAPRQAMLAALVLGGDGATSRRASPSPPGRPGTEPAGAAARGLQPVPIPQPAELSAVSGLALGAAPPILPLLAALDAIALTLLVMVVRRTLGPGSEPAPPVH